MDEPCDVCLTTEITASGYEYWLSKVRDGRMPRRADIDPAEIKRLLANVVLIDVSQDPLDFVERIAGDTILHHSHHNSMGIQWTEYPGRGPESKIWQHFEAVVTEKRAISATVPYVGPHSDYLTVELVSCPLSDNGETVNKVISFVAYILRH